MRIIVIGGMIIVAVILFRGLSNLTDDMQEIQQKKAAVNNRKNLS